MISEKMANLVQNGSAIRAMFEEGKKMAEQYGAENVYDFSLGNPSVEPPQAVKDTACRILQQEAPNLVHGYMNNSGYEDVREKIAESLNRRFFTNWKGSNIIMTVGAAGGLNVILKVLLNPGDEVVVFAPFFGEYKNYVDNFDGKLVVVPPHFPDFQPDSVDLQQALTAKTKAVIINTPNNPTGVVYSEKTILKLVKVLEEKQKEFGTNIYLISDEPYRELVYDGKKVPFLTNYYSNTIIGYSFSKSLSLPGERIGYLILPDSLDGAEEIKAAANVANRILGFVNAPSLLQRIVAECLEEQVPVKEYDKNRRQLYQALKALGYECVQPEGAFYLFVKALESDDRAFAERAKQHRLLIVPGSSFDCPGYVRIAYCVRPEVIERSLPSFARLAEDYQKIV